MYKDDIEYIIKKDSISKYRIVKFLNGEYEQEYGIVRGNKGLKCSCASGIHRNYCKHSDWIRLVEHGQKLPDNVKQEEVVNQENIDSLVNYMIGEETLICGK